MKIISLSWLATFLAVGTPTFGQATIEGEVLVAREPLHNAVVFLQSRAEQNVPWQADTAVIDQNHLRFVPSILPIRVGSTVAFLNSDPIMHNVFSPGRRGADFDLGTYPQGDRRFFTFSDPGSYVILCHVHPDMVARVLVLATPYFAVTDQRGEFRIRDVPIDSYTLNVWQRGKDPVQQSLVVSEGTRHITIELTR